MARLEEERRKREQEILEFQKQHWQVCEGASTVACCMLRDGM